MNIYMHLVHVSRMMAVHLQLSPCKDFVYPGSRCLPSFRLKSPIEAVALTRSSLPQKQNTCTYNLGNVEASISIELITETCII